MCVHVLECVRTCVYVSMWGAVCVGMCVCVCVGMCVRVCVYMCGPALCVLHKWHQLRWKSPEAFLHSQAPAPTARLCVWFWSLPSFHKV